MFLPKLFNNGDEIKYYKSKKKELSKIHTIIDEINRAIKNGHLKEESCNRQVFDLLIYSLKQVPDKIRVWIRAFRFCSKHYTRGIPRLYSLLIYLTKNEELSNPSAQYIFAVLNLIRADLIVSTTAKLVFGNIDNDKEIANKKRLLKSIWKTKTLPSYHSFVDDSLLVLDKAAAFYNLFAAELMLNPIKNQSLFFQKIEYHGETLDECFWLRWADGIINGKSPKKNNETQNLFMNYKDIISHNSDYYCPSLFSFEEKSSHDVIIEDGFLSVPQWIELVKEKGNNDPLNVLNSEWMATKIMLAICNCLQGHIKNNINIRLTPNDILIKAEEALKNSWNYQLSEANEIIIKIIENNNDEKYLSDIYLHPHTTDERVSIHTALPYCLAIIFLQLLTKRSSLPWVFNRPEYGFEWQSALNDIMCEGHVSSYNYRIISSCLSARSRETRFLSYYLGDSYIKDTYREKPEIKNWEDFQKELMKSIVLLRKNLVSVSDEQHRQLTVIDLD